MSSQHRIAALTRWSNEDPTVNAQRGQAGLRAKFTKEVTDEAAARGEQITDAERDRRADCRYRAHFVRLRYQRSLREAAKAG